MQLINIPSPAKLNLFLHIVGRMNNGYHSLQTVFQLLNYGDSLSFYRTNSREIQLSCNLLELETPQNLIHRAATTLQNHPSYKTNWGVKIDLNKILPMGGGLGGGSSNAATTLLALNQLWELNLSIQELSVIGLELGADVPAFTRGHSAWAEGIGEQLEDIDLPERWFLVIKPSCHISTELIFSHKDLTRDTPPITVAAFLDRGGKNDCQPLVESLFPQVRDAVTWLSRFAPAQLTGTGACIYASFDSKQSALDALGQAPNQLSGFVAKGVNISPLHHSLP